MDSINETPETLAPREAVIKSLRSMRIPFGFAAHEGPSEVGITLEAFAQVAEAHNTTPDALMRGVEQALVRASTKIGISTSDFGAISLIKELGGRYLYVADKRVVYAAASELQGQSRLAEQGEQGPSGRAGHR